MSYVTVSATGTEAADRTAAAVRSAGGWVMQSWPQIGVQVVHANRASFRGALLATPSQPVWAVGATRTAPVSEVLQQKHSKRSVASRADQQRERLEVAIHRGDPTESSQWNLQQLYAYDAHRTNLGSRSVLVGVMDSGIDFAHPDLKANLDVENSVSCEKSGRPSQAAGAAASAGTTHGTHVAGIIAAARNGVGVIGVAPGVRVASIKVVNSDGFIYPEYAICGFMWAASHGIKVANHSYYIDPWQYWCEDQPDQRAVAWAVRRAISWSRTQGVLNVAAAGNSGVDLAHKTVDTSSPNDGEPLTRQISDNCADLPAEASGVITVAATTASRSQANFSNRGYGIIDVAAPGQSVLSTTSGGGYGYLSGTSMAAPHAAGVLALLSSKYPNASPATLSWLLRTKAQDWPCPSTQCTGSPWYNGYFGDGVPDARAAS